MPPAPSSTREIQNYASSSSSSSSVPTEKHRHLQHSNTTSQTFSPDYNPSDDLAAYASTTHPNSADSAPAVPAAPIIIQSASDMSYQQPEAIAGPSSAPAPRSKARLGTPQPHAQPPIRKLPKVAGGTRNNTHSGDSMTPAQRAAYVARYTYADMRDTSFHSPGPLLPKIPSLYEAAVIFHTPDAPGVDYTLFRKATHDFLDFDTTFTLYPTYCSLPAEMKPSKDDWDDTRDADQDEARKVRCLFCRARFGGRNAKAMWERHAREHWDKGARASWEKQTNTKAPRNMSAKTLAQSRGHLPAAPERSSNVAPRAPSIRAAAALASTHITASEAGPSNGRSQALYLRSGSPIRATAEPIVRPPLYIRPRLSAYFSREYNPQVKLSKKEQAAHDRCTSMSDSDSDVESLYTNEDDVPPSSQSTVSTSAQAEHKPVLRTPPRHRFSSTPCTPPPPDAEPFKVRTTPFSRPGDLSHSPNILIPYNYPCTPIWTSADDEKLRTAEYDPDSPTHLLQKLEQSTMTHLHIGKKALRPYVCADGDGEGPWLHAGASYYKRSREEEEDDEELRRIWSPCKRAKTDAASPFDLEFGEDDGLKLGDFARGAMERFDLEIKPVGPLLESPFAEDDAFCGLWVNDAFTPSSFDLSSPGTD